MAQVLVVDDNLDTCNVLVKLIKRYNGPATCVESGQEAIAFVEREVPTLIFLDWMMPEMNGLEVLRTLRANPRFASLPIVMFSALSDPGVKCEALKAGAQDFIVKGDINGILSTVKKYVM